MDVVYQASNLIDAHLVRIALEQARIPAFVLGESLVGAIGELPACGLVMVCVPPSCAAEAREVVEAMPLVRGEPAEQDACPWPSGTRPA